MLSKVVSAISNTLEKKFPEAEIYVNKIKQGFEEPCFFIDLLNPSEKQIIGNRYLRSYLFDIVYFPKKKSSEEIFEVLDKLYSVLEYIELDDSTLIRGNDRNSREEDKVLHFFVAYEMFIYKLDEEKPKMKKLDVNNGLKED